MPTYQYRCRACSRDLEAFQKFTDDPLTDCPECGGSLRKVFNAVGIVFKGSGFYATDSRKSNRTAKTADATPAESSSPAESSNPTTPAVQETSSSTTAATSSSGGAASSDAA